MADVGRILPFDRFWRWLTVHYNCIVRAGTNDAWLYDQDDLHWHLWDDPDGRCGLQLMRGKQILGEVVVEGEEVAYVEMGPLSEADGQFDFQVMAGDEDSMRLLCHLVMAHGFDDESAQATH